MVRNRITMSRRGGLAVALLLGFVLGGCAGKRPEPPKLAEVEDKPMVAPVPPPSSPDFNIRVAKPLPNPETPFLAPLPVPDAPPPPVVLEPLPNPEVPVLEALPAAPEPSAPVQRAQPISRPAEPARDTVTGLTPRQTASLPPAAPAPAPVPEASYRLVFAAGSADLPASAISLVATLADLLTQDEHLRLKLNSYASGAADEPVAARKLSLQRALKVRSALVDKGIASTRVDVLALGFGDGATPADLIDIVPAN